jgi:choline dehydrogenase-like flavoprotein
MGAKDGEIAFNPDFEGAGHVMGTHRMGDEPAQTVTDSFGRAWDHGNLWLCGSGLFPTVDAANPTLTLVALTLRQAERMIGVLSNKDV